MEVTVRRYRTVGGSEPFTEWLAQLAVILLCAGNKRKQDADIERAIELWQEYKRRRNQQPAAKR